MSHLLRLLSTAACLIFLIYLCSTLGGCGDVHVDKNKAMLALRRTEMGALVLGLERYKSEHGTLPPTLIELTNQNGPFTNINASAFEYNPAGAIVSSGKSWLLFTTNPANTNQLIVGRIP